MKRILSFAVVVLVAAQLVQPVLATEDSPASEQVESQMSTESIASRFRISAIATLNNTNFVGIIDRESGQTRMLSAGDVFHGFSIEEVLPEEQSVRMARGEEKFILFLEGDATLVSVIDEGDGYDPTVEPPPAYRSMDDFLRANEHLAGESPTEPQQTVTAEEGLRRMAESVGMPVPDNALKERSREDFYKLHGMSP